MTLGISEDSWNETGLRSRLDILEKQKLQKALNSIYKEPLDFTSLKDRITKLHGKILAEDRFSLIAKIENRKIVLWPRSNTYFLEAKQQYGYNINELLQKIESYLLKQNRLG